MPHPSTLRYPGSRQAVDAAFTGPLFYTVAMSTAKMRQIAGGSHATTHTPPPPKTHHFTGATSQPKRLSYLLTAVNSAREEDQQKGDTHVQHNARRERKSNERTATTSGTQGAKKAGKAYKSSTKFKHVLFDGEEPVRTKEGLLVRYNSPIASTKPMSRHWIWRNETLKVLIGEDGKPCYDEHNEPIYHNPAIHPPERFEFITQEHLHSKRPTKVRADEHGTPLFTKPKYTKFGKAIACVCEYVKFNEETDQDMNFTIKTCKQFSDDKQVLVLASDKHTIFKPDIHKEEATTWVSSKERRGAKHVLSDPKDRNTSLPEEIADRLRTAYNRRGSEPKERSFM